nr:class I lanthipeptide [Allomuricauda sp.]
MKKNKKIGLTLNKKTISTITANQLSGGSSSGSYGGSCACGSGGGSDASYCCNMK